MSTHLDGGPAFRPPDSHYFTPTALLDGGGTAHASPVLWFTSSVHIPLFLGLAVLELEDEHQYVHDWPGAVAA